MSKLGVLQIDAVNAVARSHLLVLRPRLPTGGEAEHQVGHDLTEALLNRATYSQRDRRLVEYWCHEACYCAVDDWPLYRWRMRRGERGDLWKPLATYAAENPRKIDQLLKELERHGPASVSELEDAIETAWEKAQSKAQLKAQSMSQPGAQLAGRLGETAARVKGAVGDGAEGRGGGRVARPKRPQRKPSQWGQWNDTKKALGWLFWAGYVGVAERVNFTRRYDLIERVLPSEVVNREVSEGDAQRALLLQAAEHLGVASASDLGDYHRLPKREVPERIAELVEDGQLMPASVEGWGSTDAYMLPSTKAVRRRSQTTLLSPFDPLVWFRPRAERLFDFSYRLEIYTPAAKRRYGYYVLPFLHEDRLAARVDLKTDRAAKVLRALGAFGEPETPTSNWEVPVETALAQELQRLAEWLGMDGVALDINANGDLATKLKTASS